MACAAVRALTSHKKKLFVPGLNPGVDAKPSQMIFIRTLQFSFLHKTSNFKFDLEIADVELLFLLYNYIIYFLKKAA